MGGEHAVPIEILPAAGVSAQARIPPDLPSRRVSRCGRDVGDVAMSKAGRGEAPWSDEPLKRSGISGRHEFALSVASRIDQCVLGQGSTVFGLVGPWGSGKSTLLDEVIDGLSDWKVVWFTPWAASDVGAVTVEFIAALRGAFPEAKSLAASLAKYSRFGAPALNAVPVVGGALAAVADLAVAEMASQPAWHVTFEKLSQEIVDQRQRVLIVVDDVDRLDPDELRALLRVIRLLGRFHNVHYLLAYDQATIEQLLGGADTHGNSAGFMEKIVQHPFEVPPVPLVERRHWCRALVEAHSPEVPQGAGRLYQEQREELIRVLSEGIETPRAARRLHEQLDSLRSLIEAAEVDFLDFIALTWLRLSHHAVWDDIRANSSAYLGWSQSDSEDALEQRLTRLPALVRRGQLEPVRESIKFLFVRGGLEAGGLKRSWRMHKPRYFQRYFVVGITDEDVSDRLVTAAVDEVLAGKAGSQAREFKQSILGADIERSALALNVGLGLRRTKESTSSLLLSFLRDLQTTTKDASRNDVRRSPLERWIVAEISLAVQTAAVPRAWLLDAFGYDFIIRSAYAKQRSVGNDRTGLHAQYRPFALDWLRSLAGQELRVVLARPELAFMTGFTIWLKQPDFESGFLAKQVKTIDDLVLVAEAFVGVNEWVGSSLTYELAFNRQAFSFAVGEAIEPLDLSLLPGASDGPSYDSEDRLTSDISPHERRDFALRSLRVLRD